MIYSALCIFGGVVLGGAVIAFVAGARTLELEREAYVKGLEDRGHF